MNSNALAAFETAFQEKLAELEAGGASPAITKMAAAYGFEGDSEPTYDELLGKFAGFREAAGNAYRGGVSRMRSAGAKIKGAGTAGYQGFMKNKKSIGVGAGLTAAGAGAGFLAGRMSKKNKESDED